MKLADRTDIPVLDGGWVNLTEAADILGLTRSYLYKLAGKTPEEGGFKTLRRIGGQASYVLNVKELTKFGAARIAETLPPVEKPARKPRVKKAEVVSELKQQEFPLNIDDVMAKI